MFNEPRFYNHEGNPIPLVANKSRPGEGRAPTVTDALKLILLPSVTTVQSVIAKPGVIAWQNTTNLRAGFMYDTIEEAQEKADERRTTAATAGKRLHAAISLSLKGEPPEDDDALVTAISAEVVAFTKAMRLTAMVSEKGRALPLEGYAGTPDLVAFDSALERPIVVDFKSSERMEAYDEWLPQLWAYAHLCGYDDARLVNVIISRSEPGNVQLHDWEKQSPFIRAEDPTAVVHKTASRAFYAARDAWYSWIGPGRNLPAPAYPALLA